LAIAIVLVMRLVVPLSIFRWPLVGGILAIIADTVDILFFQWLGFPSIGYHELDKLLDTYYLAIEVIVAQRWTTLPRATATGLFIYRATGVALFEFTHDRTMLLIFPNLFEFYFLFHAARLRYARIPDLRFNQTFAVLGVLLIPKMFQEYSLHYARFLDHADALVIMENIVQSVVRTLRV
jgi:hypothetical protein